jgi:hypothetical protein
MDLSRYPRWVGCSRGSSALRLLAGLVSTIVGMRLAPVGLVGSMLPRSAS